MRASPLGQRASCPAPLDRLHIEAPFQVALGLYLVYTAHDRHEAACRASRQAVSLGHTGHGAFAAEAAARLAE